MTALPQKRTRADLVHGQLRADILAGRLVPGERLKFPDLCDHYGASVGVTREALARLTSEGLVASRVHQGYVVTPLSKADMLDLTHARMEIEISVFRQSILHGDVAWEARVIAAHHMLARTPLTDAVDGDRMRDEWARVHSEFHYELLSGCPNRRLLNIARSLRQESELYLRWSIALTDTEERDVPGEHHGLLEAAVARDVETAVASLQAHISRTAELLIDFDSISAAEDGSSPQAS